jgi:glycosyltransferase involved in cell wall biosynthesis
MNWLIPGKRKAALLVVANARTRNALPATLRRVETLTMPENGVDLTLFTPTRDRPESSGQVRLAFVGRLIDWKRVDLLIDACISIAGTTPLALHIVGDGPCLEPLKLQAGPLGDRVTFHGAVDQTAVARILADCDVLVLPSMLECGGAVVLEAMAMGKPVIATRWGGPADYLDVSCGVLIDPRTPEAFVRDLAEAIQKLAGAPALRTRLGAAGRARVERDFDWRAKAGYMLSIYRAVANCEQAHGAAELGRTTPA